MLEHSIICCPLRSKQSMERCLRIIISEIKSNLLLEVAFSFRREKSIAETTAIVLTAPYYCDSMKAQTIVVV